MELEMGCLDLVAVLLLWENHRLLEMNLVEMHLLGIQLILELVSSYLKEILKFSSKNKLMYSEQL